MSTIDPHPILDFWFRGADKRKEWFEKNAAFDAEIHTRFLPLWETALAGGLIEWRDTPRSCLAYIVLCDQFPRNMFRGEARAFATDPLALAAARGAMERGWHRELLPVEQLFVYLPYEHSEQLADQERSLELFARHENYDYAVRHWEIVKRFGRFPHRNEALGRATTPEEAEFLQQPGSGF
ncbi:MAG: DUF924 domain-containing protein [Betaproteobacteria bacterium]|nr:DUF924 domain-containing protein [Betaproteobacteria bacterium]